MEEALKKVKEEILSLKESGKESTATWTSTDLSRATWVMYVDFTYKIAQNMLDFSELKDGVLYAKYQFEEIDKYLFDIEIKESDKGKAWVDAYKACRNLFEDLKNQCVDNMLFMLEPEFPPYKP